MGEFYIVGGTAIMSMIGNYLSVDEKRLRAIINGEADILDLEEAAVGSEQDGYEVFDVDKAWQAIQYLLCGDIDEGEPPMGYVVPMMTGNAIECDLDFGAFYLTAKQAQEAYEYLKALSDEAIKNKYDFQAMVEDEVYPILTEEDENYFYDYLHAHLLALKSFFENAVKNGRAVVFYVM